MFVNFRRYVRSHELATRTLRLAEKYVQSDSWKNAEYVAFHDIMLTNETDCLPVENILNLFNLFFIREVMDWLENTADRLTKAAVSESAPSNVLKRLIKTVQEDFMTRKNVSNNQKAE